MPANENCVLQRFGGDLECQGQTGIAFPGLDRFSHAFRATNGCGSSPLKETDDRA